MKGGVDEIMKKIKVVLCVLILAAICTYILQANFFQSDNARQIPKGTRLVYEESTSPNKQYVTDEKEIVYYTIQIYQTKDKDIIISSKSNSPISGENQYEVQYDKNIKAKNVQIKWMTLGGSTEPSKDDQLGLAQVSIIENGKIIDEKIVSFVGKGVKAVTDVLK